MNGIGGKPDVAARDEATPGRNVFGGEGDERPNPQPSEFIVFGFVVAWKKGQGKKKNGDDGISPPPVDVGRSGDGGWAAKVLLFHGHAAATAANKFHGLKLVFADVLRFRIRLSAKATLCLVVARIAQMPGRLGDGAAILAGIGHISRSFRVDVAAPANMPGRIR